MRAFTIRPFGKKNDIDFDKVDRVLISPALQRVGAEGGTTIDILHAGNIRMDMFRRLLTADLVIADLTIHNANVFYELGIRHALRDRATFMLRSNVDSFPFDLQTDRYFEYNKDNPEASLEALVAALRQTIDSMTKDSPVFMSLPKLSEQDVSHFMVVPSDFGEEVDRAAATERLGDLALLSNEVKNLEWEMLGWRTIGRAQFNLKAFATAKTTWENVLTLEPADLEANFLLGTIYERLGDLVRSTQSLERALENPKMKSSDRAEAYAQMARNAKTRWRQEWNEATPEVRAATALRSPRLKESFESYERAFYEDLNHFYSGLNALAMLKIMTALAQALPDVWAEAFKTPNKAKEALDEQVHHAAQIAVAVEFALAAKFERLKCASERDRWAEISSADLNFLNTDEPSRYVATLYRTALDGADRFTFDSVRNQLVIYRDLGVLTTNLADVFKVVGEPPSAQPSAQRKRVLLFTGHRIDPPGKPTRFPGDKEKVKVAREKIREAVLGEMQKEPGVISGYAGAASGGDILFHEVCAELGIPTRLYLAIPAQKYVTTSVEDAGHEWVERFWKIYNSHYKQSQVQTLSGASDVPDERDYLPTWLRAKPDYTIWQRNNLWMLFNALNEAREPKSEDPNITLIALWDGQSGWGPGGTGYLVKKVQGMGAQCVVIDTRKEFGLP